MKDCLGGKQMQERIILAPGCNGTELLRSLAMHGVNTFNWRIMNATELARYALMHSGIAIEEEIISAKEEVGIVKEAMEGNSYFTTKSYADVQSMTNAVRMIGKLVADESSVNEILKAGVFEAKNKALGQIYSNYTKSINNAKNIEKKKKIDSVGLIHKAIVKCNDVKFDIYTLKEYPLMPLEKALLDTLANNSKESISLLNLFGGSYEKTHVESIKACYGAPNEVETALDEIYSKYNLDKCTLVIADTKTYSQLIFDYAVLYNLPITFGTGIPIKNSNPARLLKLYSLWAGANAFNTNEFNAMINDNSFNLGKLVKLLKDSVKKKVEDKILTYDISIFDKDTKEKSSKFQWRYFFEVLGNLRITNSVSTNKQRLDGFKEAVAYDLNNVSADDREFKNVRLRELYVPVLEIVINEFNLKPEEFIKKYARLRTSSSNIKEILLKDLDVAASGTIAAELSNFRKFGEEDVLSIVPDILNLSVLRQSCEGNKLHVCGVQGAITAIRSNMYILGMSAKNYPGAPKENYLLLDSDLEKFGAAGVEHTSNAKVINKLEFFDTILKLCSSLKCNIHLSFASKNVSDLKEQNASSVISNLLENVTNLENTKIDLEEVPYFEPKLSVTNVIGDNYNNAKIQLSNDEVAVDSEKYKCKLSDYGYSPSTLNDYFDCPRKFMLKHILGLKEPEEKKPYEILPATDNGTLAHALMEKLNNSKKLTGSYLTEDEFLMEAKISFDNYLKKNPPLIAEGVDKVKEYFVDMMRTAFRQDPHNEVVLQEEKIQGEIKGVNLHGYPDRVEKITDDEYVVVDFKTGKKDKHAITSKTTLDKIVGMYRQTFIYAYLLESKYAIKKCEYRYPALGIIEGYSFNQLVKNELEKQIEEFKNAVENGNFPYCSTSETSEPCKYCKFINVCGKKA